MSQKEKKSKKSKDSKVKKQKKQDGNKSQKSASKSKGKEGSKGKDQSKSKQKNGSKTPPKKQKQNKSKKPGDGHSEKSSISQIATPPADCIHHKSPFINFCETCEQLVCNQCTVFGPHNNHLHRILKMTDAYRLRKFYLVQAIRSNLVDKRDKIIAQLHRLEYRIQEIRFVKNIIERDIRSQYSGILQRLKGFQGHKLATLTHQVSLVQRQLDTINDIGNKFFQLTNMQCDKLQQQRRINRFLHQSKQMYETIQYITSKPDRIHPQLALQELPRQVQVNRDLVKKALAARQINNFKNQILWKLVIDLRAQQNGLRRQVQDKANSHIKLVSEQVQQLNNLLKQKRLLCYFCGNKMNSQTVNQECSSNQSTNLSVSPNFHPSKQPTQKHIGNKRHFFTKPA